MMESWVARFPLLGLDEVWKGAPDRGNAGAGKAEFRLILTQWLACHGQDQEAQRLMPSRFASPVRMGRQFRVPNNNRF